MPEDKSHTASPTPTTGSNLTGVEAQAAAPLLGTLGARDLRPWLALIFAALALTLLSLKWPFVRWLGGFAVAALGLRSLLGFAAARAMAADPEE